MRALTVLSRSRGLEDRRWLLSKPQRLSATDISALASMKNVAKCDTWCELQNPVNHRVFERKLRLKPLGRRHVCLGVTHLVTPSTTTLDEVDYDLLCLQVQLVEIRVRSLGPHDKWWLENNSRHVVCRNSVPLKTLRRVFSIHFMLGCSCYDRDPRSGGITR